MMLAAILRALAFEHGIANQILLRYLSRICYNSQRSTRMEPPVDLALNLNVLAVLAVFAFVAALLIGAF